MNHSRSASEIFSDFITSLGFQDIPDSVKHRARLHILDTLGAGIAGAASREVAISRSALLAGYGLADEAQASGGLPGRADRPKAVPLWGAPAVAPPLAAAFINGVASHAFELDDSGGCDHSGAVVLPAALAAAAMRDEPVPGAQLMHAVVAGYELARRVQDALGGYDAVNNLGWHSTGVCGTFGAAVAAGIILELDSRQMASAIGLAGSFTGGTWAFIGDGAMSKRMHVGRAAEAGLNSALLARGGFTGPADLFSAPWGSFLKIYGGSSGVSTDESAIHATLGKDWQIDKASIKPYASCRSTHSAIDAALELQRKHGFTTEDIRGITVRTSSLIMDMCGKMDVSSLVSAQLSMHFAVATALLRGGVGLDDITEQGRTDPRVSALMGLISLELDPAQQGGSAEPYLTVSTADGDYSLQAVRARGASTNRLSDEETIGKFMSLAGARLAPDDAVELVNLVTRLEDVPDIARVQQLLSASREASVIS
ncbi:MmgE/PrpD family protein [Arthrobacter sp. NPDC058127]|uniref:MmgE/PrpD family protein n=1 Tax=Arthrobacter sp. NPDC058127 TaxID=3346351 RepID=UPI0036E66013